MPFPIEDFVLEFHVPNATDATNQLALIAPYDLKVVQVRARHRVASTSGTMDLKKAASGVALSAGASVLNATMSNAGAADTNVVGSLKTTIGDTTVPEGSALGFVFAGTLTNLVDLDITLVLRQLKKAFLP
jgi:hypothetical protein